MALAFLRPVYAGLLLLGLGVASDSSALSFNLGASPTRQLHIQVGTGGNGTTTMATVNVINMMTVSVPAASLGQGVSQKFVPSDTNTIDPYPPVALTCNDGYKLLISAIARVPTGTSTATLQVNSVTPLSNGLGNTLSFNTISWVASDTSIPSGTYNGTAAQTLATFNTSTQIENCHTFSYSNGAMIPAGTYTGRVVYTLSMP
jgi:hypothetical protein